AQAHWKAALERARRPRHRPARAHLQLRPPLHWRRQRQEDQARAAAEREPLHQRPRPDGRHPALERPARRLSASDPLPAFVLSRCPTKARSEVPEAPENPPRRAPLMFVHRKASLARRWVTGRAEDRKGDRRRRSPSALPVAGLRSLRRTFNSSGWEAFSLTRGGNLDQFVLGVVTPSASFWAIWSL